VVFCVLRKARRTGLYTVARTSRANRLELVTQTNNGLRYAYVLERVAVAVCTNCVHVGALGQTVCVAQAEQVLVVLDSASIVFPGTSGAGSLPSSQDFTVTQRSAQADSVVVGLEVADVGSTTQTGTETIAIRVSFASNRIESGCTTFVDT